MSDSIKLLRIYTDEAAFVGDRKVFEHIAEAARDRAPSPPPERQ